jgi:hypothetical protein
MARGRTKEDPCGMLQAIEEAPFLSFLATNFCVEKSRISFILRGNVYPVTLSDDFTIG